MKENSIAHLFILLASIIIVLAGIKSAAVMIVPFLLSLFIAIILSPAFGYLNSRATPQALSLLIVMGSFLLFLLLVAKLIGTSISDFSANSELYTQRLTLYYHSVTEFLQEYNIEIPQDTLVNFLHSNNIMSFATTLLQSMSAMLSNGFVVLLTVIFMLLESQHFTEKLAYIDGSQKRLDSIQEIFAQIQNYMVLKAIISLLTAAIIWAALSIVGTEYAFLWAVIAFLFNFIPNIGSIIAALPALLITLVQLGPISTGVVAIIYLGVNIVVGSVIEPRVMGRGLGLSTLVVFLSLLFWGWLLGVVGMLLSIPLTIMVKIILNTNINTRSIAVMLGTGEHLDTKVKQ